MSEKTQTKKKLSELIDEFRQLDERGSFKGQYEPTARTWVERFLNVFHWNSSDPQQVSQEYRIKGRAARRLKTEGTSHIRPDYCLVSNGQRILYIDAKKIGANIKDDASIAYQVRCYGWSEKCTVSYAFDFKELAIYDCRFIPKDDDESDMARIHYFHYSQYLDNFDLLWEYFSKVAIDSGSLSRLHPEKERPKGTKTLDEDFEEKLSYWRKELAKSILRYGKERDPTIISAAAQRILDRIIFLRICEELGLEELGALLEMGQDEDGFWPLFMESHDKRYSKVYDGILFPAKDEDDPSGIDRHLRTWWLKGRIFKEIVSSLYYPHPYRFNVVPIELLGGIYEKYLGKRLRVVGNEVADEFKPEYQRTKGAVYTPKWIVDRVVEKTLAPIIEGKDPDEIIRNRILDPACGSGSFLLGVFDFMKKQIIKWFTNHPDDQRRSSFVVETDAGLQLTLQVAKQIINHCIYGVDIDAEAVEVARMSLAIHYLGQTVAIMDEPNSLLNGIGLNIRQGNSLVGTDVIKLGIEIEEIIKETMPFDWCNEITGFGTVMKNGRFDAIVGNPPYIEVKRYKEWMPYQYKYLKDGGVYVTTAQGKTDLAMPFMEKGLKLLKHDGRLGFIIQNRFFKTDYGEIVRSWLIQNKALADIEDFRDIQIFEKRTTYTAILILHKDSPAINYSTYDSIDDAISKKPSIQCKIEWDAVDANVWSFDQPDLLEVHHELEKRHGTIGQHNIFQISVGLQTLWGKLYQLEPVEVKPRTIVGKNGMGEVVSLERAAMRPLCKNRGFYPFRIDNADAWVIFPYEIVNGEVKEILWKEFRGRYPKTATYLEERKHALLKSVDVENGVDRWHLYLYPKNLIGQATTKVLFPSTIEDTASTVDQIGDIYQDNVRINSMSFTDATTQQLKSIACVFNSTLFNALARLKAGLSDSGWRQLNKQYIELVPFPKSIVFDEKTVVMMSHLFDKISKLQNDALGLSDEGARNSLRATIESLWGELDSVVEATYGLSASQKEIVKRYPRRVNRYELLFRQNSIEIEEDTENVIKKYF